MNTLSLPDPIAAYFSADEQGPDAVARCFAADAVVTDEGHAHVGRDAIASWKAGIAYTYSNEPFALERKDGGQGGISQVRVISRVSGNFPGSPVDLRYDFRLERGLIASLEIGT